MQKSTVRRDFDLNYCIAVFYLLYNDLNEVVKTHKKIFLYGGILRNIGYQKKDLIFLKHGGMF